REPAIRGYGWPRCGACRCGPRLGPGKVPLERRCLVHVRGRSPMMSRRLFIQVVIVAVGLVLSAACGGSAAQRAALRLQGEKAGQPSAAPGGAVAGDSGAVSIPGPAASSELGSAVPVVGPTGSDRGQPSGTGSALPSAAPSVKVDTPGAGSAANSHSGPAKSSTAAGARTAAGSAPAPAQPTPSGATPGGPAVGGATDVGVTATSIKVGHTGIYSGPVGSFGDDLSYAGRAKLQEINDAGGINGRKLDVLVRDDAWDGTKGMNAARDLVEREHIFAFCCIMSVNTSDPLTPYADEHKIPHIGADGWGEP